MIKGKAEVAFGRGDVRTTTMLYGEVGMYVLDNQLPHKIGESIPIEDDFTVAGKDVMLTFSNIDSLDVVINDLLEVKRLMIEGKDAGCKELDTKPSDFWNDQVNKI